MQAGGGGAGGGGGESEAGEGGHDEGLWRFDLFGLTEQKADTGAVDAGGFTLNNSPLTSGTRIDSGASGLSMGTMNVVNVSVTENGC